MQRIGYVGASGLMGHGMAKNLLEKGFPLSYTVNRREPEGLAQGGATKVDSHAELGRDCDVVVICVTSAPDVEAVVGGLLTDPKEGLVIVDTSTSEPGVTLRLAQECSAKGVRLVDAPVTRGPAEAESGTLNTIVGADDETFEQVRPVLEAYSENIFHVGDTGAGHVVKLLNNFVFQAGVNALAEAFALSSKTGVDPQHLVDVLGVGNFRSPLVEMMAKSLHGEYRQMAFELDNARKDIRYYTRLAGEQGMPSLVGDGVHQALTLASALGFGDRYVPSVVEAQQQLNSVEIRTTRGDG